MCRVTLSLLMQSQKIFLAKAHVFVQKKLSQRRFISNSQGLFA